MTREELQDASKYAIRASRESYDFTLFRAILTALAVLLQHEADKQAEQAGTEP